MPETLKQFTQDLAAALKARLASPETAEFVAKAKSAGDDRTFEVVMSTSDEDRQGDSLDQSKWDLKYYTENPVVLFAHDYSGIPIGITDDIETKGDETIARGHFAPAGLNPQADVLCALYQAKILRAVSPGYIQNDDGTRELLEISFCAVPAGRFALSLRQVKELGMSTQDLVTKGFFYSDSPPTTKAPKVGDTCELDDGTSGTLADDPKNPGTLICIPSESKSQNMNDELENNFKAENERHGKAVAKAIDEFKSIDEFEKAIDGEQTEHHDKCMKAIDDAYALEDQHPQKSIDEFKAAVDDEHLTHVKAADKAIEEFKGAYGDSDDDHAKAIEEFTKAIGTELDRHERAHEDLLKGEPEDADGSGESEKKFYEWREKGAVAEELAEDEEMQAKYLKLNKAFDIFYAFSSAYLDEKTGVDDFDKLLDEAVGLMKGLEKKAEGILAAKLKAGRAISAKNKDKLQAIIKAIEDHHTEHGKHTDEITAALKAIIASGGGGEEPSDGEEPEKKALNSRSSTSGATAELETYLFTQRLVRQVKTASEGALRQINDKIKKARTSGR